MARAVDESDVLPGDVGGVATGGKPTVDFAVEEDRTLRSTGGDNHYWLSPAPSTHEA